MGDNKDVVAVAMPHPDAGVAVEHVETTPTTALDTPQVQNEHDTPEVVLRFEFITAGEVKVISSLLYLAIASGLVSTVCLIILKVRKQPEYFLNRTTVQRANLIVSTIILAGCCGMFLWMTVRVLQRFHQQGRWSYRRWQLIGFSYAEICVQITNLVFFLLPNAYTITRPCSLFSTFVNVCQFIRWTCWNTTFLIFIVHASNTNPWRDPQTGKGMNGKDDAIIMDAPVTYHWRKLGFWVCMEAIVIAVLAQTESSRRSSPSGIVSNCGLTTDCHQPHSILVLTILVVVCILVYAVAYLVYIRRSYVELRSRPYQQYRIGNLAIRMQLRTRLPVFVFILISLPLLWFLHIDTCGSYALAWLGIMPMQIVTSMMTIINGFMFTPAHTQRRRKVRLDVLQDLAWTEAQWREKIKQRSRNLPMAQAPLFCLEVALKAMHWCNLAYEPEGPETEAKIEDALHLFGLEQYETLEEAVYDTRALLGWGGNNIMLCFRGTASLSNVLVDLQAWRSNYGEDYSCWSRPRVHRGFLRSWHANGLSQRIVARIAELIKGMDRSSVHILLTGHSLGGALATLAAMDLRKSQLVDPPLGPTEISCYTYGAPRTGNHVFAGHYDDFVPDTWHIINDQDMVATGFKFGLMYKRPGHRVLINPYGDIIVRPSPAEINVTKSVGAGSVNDHMLSTGYSKSFEALLAAQKGSKAMPGGAEGAAALARVAKTVGLHLDAVELSWEEPSLRAQLLQHAKGMLEYFKPPSDGCLSSCLPAGKNFRANAQLRHGARETADVELGEPPAGGTTACTPPSCVDV